MSEFDRSRWAKPEFSRDYRYGADVFIVERQRLLDIMKSFYKHFSGDKPGNNVLDLGCGDGIVTHELLEIDSSIKSTLIDASADMINKAKDRLKDFGDLLFIQGSFQDILNKIIALGSYDFVVSSLAIHHLTLEEKLDLFDIIYAHLNPGGCFLNIDVVLSPADTLEEWYLVLWKQWLDERKSVLGIEGGHYDDIMKRYKDGAENKPDTLGAQIEALQSIGFKDVDCFYKYGIFTIYGGRK
jgi:tRNA (cmo5U34)-methyltransferase